MRNMIILQKKFFQIPYKLIKTQDCLSDIPIGAEFYKEKLNSTKYKPNITHKVLKKLEDHNLLSSIITQNIDGFDIEAGSKNVIELHGSIKRNYCTKCHKFYDEKYIFNSKDIMLLLNQMLSYTKNL